MTSRAFGRDALAVLLAVLGMVLVVAEGVALEATGGIRAVQPSDVAVTGTALILLALAVALAFAPRHRGTTRRRR